MNAERKFAQSISWSQAHWCYLHWGEGHFDADQWKIVCRKAALHWWCVRLPISLAVMAIIIAIVEYRP